MPPDPVDVFRRSLHRCLGDPSFIESFYERFVGSSEEVRERFKNTDMKRQVRMLEDSLFVLAVAVQSGAESPARGSLPGIAERHSSRDLDIKPELYDVWLEALIETAGRYDPEFAPEIEEAWRGTLAAGIEYMRSRY
jgi:hemoglobin-like flavoprotein